MFLIDISLIPLSLPNSIGKNTNPNYACVHPIARSERQRIEPHQQPLQSNAPADYIFLSSLLLDGAVGRQNS
jgi:hypothetical protein